MQYMPLVHTHLHCNVGCDRMIFYSARVKPTCAKSWYFHLAIYSILICVSSICCVHDTSNIHHILRICLFRKNLLLLQKVKHMGQREISHKCVWAMATIRSVCAASCHLFTGNNKCWTMFFSLTCAFFIGKVSMFCVVYAASTLGMALA